MNPPRPGSPSEAMAKNSHTPPRPGSSGHKPAHTIQVARIDAVIQCAHQDEERAGADAMGDDDEQRALQRQLIPGEDAQQHESHMADAGIGDQAFEIDSARRRGWRRK